MPSLAELPEIIGFFSYSRDDDEDSHNALSTIRALIQNELRARLGRSRQSLRLWQDQEAIAPGSMWESQINAAVQQSVFFIPIITPRVINSKYCGVEFNRFLDREKELRRDDLVFPVLYIDVDELQDESRWRGHPLLEVIGQRQYVDWREYRYESESPALRRAVASLCTRITTALRRPSPNERTEIDGKAVAQREAERVAAELAETKRQRDDAAEHARLKEEDRKRNESVTLQPPPEGDQKTQRQERQGVDRQSTKSRPKPLRAALEWGTVGAISVAINWALSVLMLGAVFGIWTDFLFSVPSGLAAAIMLYRSHLTLKSAASAGTALMILRGFTLLLFRPLIGANGILIISGFPILVLAFFEPRLRALSLWLKVLAVFIGFGLAEIGIWNSLHSLVSNWVLSILARFIYFALFGYEISRQDARSL